MSGPPRYNPSRRSRFRAHGSGNLQRPDPSSPEAGVHSEDATAQGAADAESISRDETAEQSANESLAHEPAALETGFDAERVTQRPAADAALALPTVPAADAPAADHDLPPAFQLRKVYDGPAPQTAIGRSIYLTLGGLLLLLAGLAGGYFYGMSNAAPRAIRPLTITTLPDKTGTVQALDAQTQAAVDAAFDATKQRHYEDARKQFAALYAAHPEWSSMAIESARATLYEADAQATGKILSDLTKNGPLPDAEFLKALLRLTHKEFDPADASFAAAVALDPARPDFYYFWGECLRSQGKPREAAEKFHSALIRNQYETAEDLYQLKFWLSQIQADQEESSGSNAKINAGLALTPRPPYSAVFAAAARELKASRFPEAARYLAQGQQLTEPVVYRVILQDPVFVQESWRPELAPFYK